MCVFKGKDARVFISSSGTGKGHASMFGNQFEVPVNWTICLGVFIEQGLRMSTSVKGKVYLLTGTLS